MVAPRRWEAPWKAVKEDESRVVKTPSIADSR
jgi:hypothetical protein